MRTTRSEVEFIARFTLPLLAGLEKKERERGRRKSEAMNDINGPRLVRVRAKRVWRKSSAEKIIIRKKSNTSSESTPHSSERQAKHLQQMEESHQFRFLLFWSRYAMCRLSLIVRVWDSQLSYKMVSTISMLSSHLKNPESFSMFVSKHPQEK